MSYTCTLFSNTGFNAVNIPDSPALLNSVGSPLSAPALDIVQDRFLRSAKVHATYAQVKDVDYALIGDFYYVVESIKMLNGDTAELSLLPDFLTSAGGPAVLEFLDGLTERVHVNDDDTYGKYNEDDELMAPSEPLRIRTVGAGGSGDSTGNFDFVEATINLKSTGTSDIAKTYTDSVTGESVTVPQNEPLGDFTTYHIGPSQGAGVSNSSGVFNLDPDVRNGIQKCRALGTESAIISQWRVPGRFIDHVGIDLVWGGYSGIWGIDSDIGTSADTATGIPFKNYHNYTPNNFKVWYSNFTKYGILTMAGDKIEVSPWELSQQSSGAAVSAPQVHVMSDPRPDGKPYYKFTSYKSNRPQLGYVSGCRWANIPLLYTDKSGSELTRLQYQAEREYDYDRTKMSAGAAMVGGLFTGASRGGLAGAAVGLIAGGFGAIGLAREYAERSEKEYLKYVINTQIVAPELQIPYNGDFMRDVWGNGAIVYRYLYSPNDLQRIDKLLTMYGYKHTKALEASDFSNRTSRTPYANYVRARGVSVTAKTSGGVSVALPYWWCEGIAAQLEAGTRVWHRKPSPLYYS